MKIALMDLKREYMEIRDEANQKVIDVLESAKYIMGENVQSFEREFEQKMCVRHAVSVANGTDALILALKALNIGEGDEVITTDYTFFATCEAIAFVKATPVFVDVELDTYNMDPCKIEEKITEKTKAIIAVHIFGQPAKMDQINAIAKKHHLKVVEDAAQAVNAQYQGQMIGGLSDIACFSFFPTKNLAGAGDGGMITTNDDGLATIVRALRVHGSGENGLRAYNLLNDTDEEVTVSEDGDQTVYNPLKYYNYLIGHNSRLDELQAALLRIQLRNIDQKTDRRIAHAKYYDEKLEHSKLIRPSVVDGGKHVFHLYILQSEQREALCDYLKEKGIATGIYYPVPMHLQKVFRDLNYKEGDFPNAEYLSKRTFAIPMFPTLTKEEQDYIIESILEFER